MSLPFWFYWQGIPTPDMSLIPQVPATVGFGTAFIFGWLVHRSSDCARGHHARWFAHLVLGIVATGWLLHTMHAAADGAARARPRRCTRWCSASRYGAGCSASRAPRCASSLTTAPRAATSPTPRTGSTSRTCRWSRRSQIWVGHWPLHWSVKYPFILVASFAVLFLSYHFLVRPTFIGKLLNGRKYPSQAGAARAPRPAPASPTACRYRQWRSRWRSCAASPRSYGADHRARPDRHRSAPRRIAGGARPERRRQVHGDLAVAGPHRGGRGRGHAARRCAAGHRAAPRARRDDAGRGDAQGAQGARARARSPRATTTIR